MAWSTVEWPPKNGSNIKPKPKPRIKYKVLIFICLTLILLLAGALRWGLLPESNKLSFIETVNVMEKLELIQKNIYNYCQGLLDKLVMDRKADTGIIPIG